MSTKSLVINLAAGAITAGFLLFFIPWSLNASDSLLNAIGALVCVALAIAVLAVLHSRSK